MRFTDKKNASSKRPFLMPEECMPRASFSYQGRVLEVSVQNDIDECPICTMPLCLDETPRNVCPRLATTLGCCLQVLCCGCLMKLPVKICACKEDCDAVVAVCPFCRDAVGVSAQELLVGSRTRVCSACK